MKIINNLFWLFIGFDQYSLGVSFNFEIQRAFGVDIVLHVKLLGLYLTLRSNLIAPKGATIVGNVIVPDDLDHG